MAENLYCPGLKGNSREYLDGYDTAFRGRRFTGEIDWLKRYSISTIYSRRAYETYGPEDGSLLRRVYNRVYSFRIPHTLVYDCWEGVTSEAFYFLLAGIEQGSLAETLGMSGAEVCYKEEGMPSRILTNDDALDIIETDLFDDPRMAYCVSSMLNRNERIVFQSRKPWEITHDRNTDYLEAYARFVFVVLGEGETHHPLSYE